MAKQEKKLSQKKAVAMAMEARPADAKSNVNLASYIRSELGLDMTPAQIAVAKGALKRTSTSKEATTSNNQTTAATPAQLRAIKALVDQLGKDVLAEFVEVL